MDPVKVRKIEIGTGIPKIVVPIVATTKGEILGVAKNIRAAAADIVEWRADWYEDVFDFIKVEATAKALRDVLGDTPILFTFRTAKEGGEKAIDTDAYVELNKNIVETGYVDMVDVEVFTGDEYVKEIIEAAHAKGIKVVASNHDFFKTPEQDDIVSRLCKMQELDADILKIAVTPQNRKDVITLLAAAEEMVNKHADRPIVTISMTSTGVISRVCGEVFGSALTFASVGVSSAPGQIDIEELRTILEQMHKILG